MVQTTPRKYIRRGITGVAVFLFTLYLGEFIISYGHEQGWFDDTTSKVKAVMDFFAGIINSQYFLYTCFFVAGITLGIWIDYFLKKKETPADSISDDGLVSHLDCSESLKIMTFHIDHHALRDRNPKLSFWMIAYNGTTKEIRLNNTTGSLFYKGDYPGNLECKIEDEPIPSGETFLVTLYQWISKQDAQQIIDVSSKEAHISFGFSKINISINCHKKIINLLIPNSLQFHIKQDWRVQPDGDFYRPTWQDKQ